MLTRRHIREKVMKALYAFFQSDNQEIAAGEKELFHSIDRVYDLYLYYLALPAALSHYAGIYLDEKKQKRLPTHEDLNPFLNFVENPIIQGLEKSEELNRLLTKHKINWTGEQELIKKLYFSFKDESWFRDYLQKPDAAFEEHREVLYNIYEQCLFPSEIIRQYFEEKSIYWLDDIELMQTGVLKTIKGIKEDNPVDFRIQNLHKETEEDRKFASDLFRKTIVHSDAFQNEIAGRTQNWEIDRIARMDVILMKMAICELTEFSSIPVKVTLDEYIELSKDYSSPQSKNFINGVLDKVVSDFRRNNKIVKTGRGLVE